MQAEKIAHRLPELGGFGAKLYDLWCVADSSNRAIIEQAFAHLFRRFDPSFGLNQTPHELLRYHISGAIARAEAEPIVGIPAQQ